MIVSATLNTDGFMGKTRAMLGARRVRLRTAAAATGAYVFTETLMKIARRDTQRYVRGWAMANNMAGLPRVPVPNVRPSKYAETYLKILGDQVDAFAGRVAKYEYLIESRFRRVNRPMRGRYYNELNSALNRAYTRLERAREELKNAARKHSINIPDYLFIGLYNKDGQYRPMIGKNTRGRTARQLATIRTKVYGGTGRAVINDYQSVFVLHNREPHVTLLEARYHYVASAARMARVLGVKKMATKYVAGMQAVMRGGGATNG